MADSGLTTIDGKSLVLSRASFARKLTPESVAVLTEDAFRRLEKIIAAGAKGGWSKKTTAAFFSDGKIFATWCLAHDQRWLPAGAETVQMFVEAMAAEGRSPFSIDRMMWAIAKWHRHAGFANPVEDDLVDLARKAHKREVGTRQSQAKGMGEAQVVLLAGQLTDTVVETGIEPDLLDEETEKRILVWLRALRDHALILVAHDTLARVSELVAFRKADLEFAADGTGLILKRRSKTDQTGKGKKKWLAAATVASLQRWIRAEEAVLLRKRASEERRVALLHAKRFETKGKPQGRKRIHEAVEPVRFDWPDSPYLFRGLAPVYTFDELVNEDGTVTRGSLRRATGWSIQLNTNTVSTVFKTRLEECGVDPAGYSAHSSRVGKLQDLLAKGVNLFGAMEAGDWSSPEMPARYGENILASLGAVAQTSTGTL